MGKKLNEQTRQTFATAISDQLIKLQTLVVDSDERRYQNDKPTSNISIGNTLSKSFGSRWTPITTELGRLDRLINTRLKSVEKAKEKATTEQSIETYNYYKTCVSLLKSDIYRFGCALNQTLTYFDEKQKDVDAKEGEFRAHINLLSEKNDQLEGHVQTLGAISANIINVNRVTGEESAVRTGKNHLNTPLPYFLKNISAPYESGRNSRTLANTQHSDRPNQMDFLKKIGEASSANPEAMIGALLLVKHLIEESAPNRGQPLKLFCLPVSHGSDLLRIIDSRLNQEVAKGTYNQAERPQNYYVALRDTCSDQVQNHQYSSALEGLINPALTAKLD